MYQLLDNEKSSLQFSNYGSFGARLVAILLDLIFLFFVQVLLYYVFNKSLLTNIIVSIMSALYFIIMESGEKQATLGKQAMNLVVTNMNGERLTPVQAAGRYFAKLVSAIILFIGYWMQPFTEKKQALHDIMAGTLVFKK